MTWRRTRLKYLAAEPIVNGLGEAARLEDESWPRYIRTTDFASTRDLRDDTLATLPPDLARQADVRRGDILMSAAGTVGKTFLYGSDEPACYAGYLVRFRPRRDVDSRFVAYWTETPLFIDQVETGKVTSTIDNFSAGKYQNLQIAIPDRATQGTIADFLDTETARIDALITKKQRLAEVLAERFATDVEQRLLTAGKPVPLRRLLVEPPRYGAGQSGEPAVEGHPRYIRITDLTPDGRLKDDGAKTLPPDVARPYLLSHDDILVARSGATAGKAFRFRRDMGDACYAGYLIRLRFDPAKVAPPLVESWMQTADYRGQISESAIQATIQNVNAERYKNLIVPVPDRVRQEKLVEHFTRRRDQLRRMERMTARQVALLREHRQALITAAVTGELEVPEVAA